MKRLAVILVAVSCMGCQLFLPTTKQGRDDTTALEALQADVLAYGSGLGTGLLMAKNTGDPDTMIAAIDLRETANNEIIYMQATTESYALARFKAKLLASNFVDELILVGVVSQIRLGAGILDENQAMDDQQKTNFGKWLSGFVNGLDRKIDESKKKLGFQQ